MTRKLAEIRKANRVTTEELAERLDTAVQNVRRIEAGQNITLRTLARIARALGMDVDVVFRPDPAGPRRPPPGKRRGE